NIWDIRNGAIFATEQEPMQGWSPVSTGAFEGAPGETDILWRDAGGALVEWSFGLHQADLVPFT
ncbi:MAG: hypothetical protein ACJ8CH_03105, partial [Microvirga sp.]